MKYNLVTSREMRGMGRVARMGEMRNVYRILVRKSEERRQLKRSTCTWEDNIRTDLRETR
jgi:hypothetical protein